MGELCLFPSPINSPVGQTSSIGNGKCFAFLLSNNTSNQYGVCLQITRIFKDLSKGVNVTCDYCICMISKLPFLSYLFNLLLQLDTQGGLDFTEPVQRYYPDNFLIPPTFKILVEFTRLIRSVKVPLYRLGAKYLARDYVEEEIIRLDATKSSYAPISFNMVVKPVLTDGLLGHFMDSSTNSYGISSSTLAQQTQSQYNVSSSSPPLSKVSKSNKKTLHGVFRRDLMGSYSSLPPTTTQTKHPEPPFLHSPRRNISDSLLAQLEEEREKEVCFHTLLWALPALLRHLPLDQIILAVGCALTEMRVVVVGTDLGVVSGCVLALVNLLRPLKWAGPVIVTLPSSLHAYLESPVPLILGMQSLPEGFKLAPGIIMIDPKVRITRTSSPLHPTPFPYLALLCIPLISTFPIEMVTACGVTYDCDALLSCGCNETFLSHLFDPHFCTHLPYFYPHPDPALSRLFSPTVYSSS